MSTKIPLLVLNSLSSAHQAQIAEIYDATYAFDAAERAAAIAEHGKTFRAVLTIGVIGITPEEIAALPAVEPICCMGAGYEGVPLEVTRARGIVTANGAGTNDDCVADHAFALLLAVVRGIPTVDAACRQGVWRDRLPLRPNFSHKRLGILGLGTIGAKLAQRGQGFDLAIGYHNRKPKPDVAHTYFDSPVALAEWADYLVVATPGGAATRYLVDARVLQALGPRGVLVNIARGSVVDTLALADALREGHVGGAGLDVYESEPEPPSVLFDLPNVVLTPHVAGSSPDAIAASVERFIENATRHFAGQAPVSPV